MMANGSCVLESSPLREWLMNASRLRTSDVNRRFPSCSRLRASCAESIPVSYLARNIRIRDTADVFTRSAPTLAGRSQHLPPLQQGTSLALWRPEVGTYAQV